MPIYSIVTAVVNGKDEYLRDTYESIRIQEMPTGWEWEWLLQEDGETGRPLLRVPDDPRISKGQGASGRAATARTIALGRATGLLTRALDADDLFLPNAIARDINAITSHSEVSWCVSPALDLLPDGTTRPGPRDPAPGLARPDLFLDGAQAGEFPLLGVTACTYTDLLRALGGWPAVPTQEDVHLLMALETVSRGYILGDPSILYRRWPGSTTHHLDKSVTSHGDPALSAVSSSRIRALRATGWAWRAQQN